MVIGLEKERRGGLRGVQGALSVEGAVWYAEGEQGSPYSYCTQLNSLETSSPLLPSLPSRSLRFTAELSLPPSSTSNNTSLCSA